MLKLVLYLLVLLSAISTLIIVASTNITRIRVLISIASGFLSGFLGVYAGGVYMGSVGLGTFILAIFIGIIATGFGVGSGYLYRWQRTQVLERLRRHLEEKSKVASS